MAPRTIIWAQLGTPNPQRHKIIELFENGQLHVVNLGSGKHAVVEMDDIWAIELAKSKISLTFRLKKFDIDTRKRTKTNG